VRRVNDMIALDENFRFRDRPRGQIRAVMRRPDAGTRLGWRRRVSCYGRFGHLVRNFFHCLLLIHHVACRLAFPSWPPLTGGLRPLRAHHYRFQLFLDLADTVTIALFHRARHSRTSIVGGLPAKAKNDTINPVPRQRLKPDNGDEPSGRARLRREKISLAGLVLPLVRIVRWNALTGNVRP
jgi:hypothetical protein